MEEVVALGEEGLAQGEPLRWDANHDGYDEDKDDEDNGHTDDDNEDFCLSRYDCVVGWAQCRVVVGQPRMIWTLPSLLLDQLQLLSGGESESLSCHHQSAILCHFHISKYPSHPT